MCDASAAKLTRKQTKDAGMTLDTDKIDDAALALLSLTLHDGDRVWKGINWEITDRLFAKGLIYDPKNKGKSLRLTPEGIAHAGANLARAFSKAE